MNHVHVTLNLAGMPSLNLTDVANARLSSISFFLLLAFLSAFLVRVVWNSLRNDFPALPQLTLKGAMAAVCLWGLAFVVVLTMISGARELMTPGAWQKNGLTYQLSTDANPKSPAVASEVQAQLDQRLLRMNQLSQLNLRLQSFRHDHGQFPSQHEFEGIAGGLNTVPGDLPAQYLYRAGEPTDDNDSALVIEPAIFGNSQFVLTRSGTLSLRAAN